MSSGHWLYLGDRDLDWCYWKKSVSLDEAVTKLFVVIMQKSSWFLFGDSL